MKQKQTFENKKLILVNSSFNNIDDYSKYDLKPRPSALFGKNDFYTNELFGIDM